MQKGKWYPMDVGDKRNEPRMCRAVTTDVLPLGEVMKRLRRQRPFLESVLKEANRHKRQQMIEHANADQINAVSEMVLNLLKKRIPVDATTYGKLKRHKNVLREVGKRRNSIKRRRQHLFQQTGSGFWKGLHRCFKSCCRVR